MNLKLYVIPGSHPCKAVEQALKVKGIEYDRVDLLPGMHIAAQKILFRENTVPGIKGDGFKIVGTRKIMRFLDSMQPEPRLYPLDPDERAKVEEAERWGEEIFQPVGRTLIWPTFQRDPQSMRTFAEGSNSFIPIDWAMSAVGPVIAFEKWWNKTDDQKAQATIAKLPGYIEQIDRWIDAGIIGSEQPNAADLQIGSTVWILRALNDLEPLFADTQAADLVRYFPADNARVPAGTLPSEWVNSQLAK